MSKYARQEEHDIHKTVDEKEEGDWETGASQSTSLIGFLPGDLKFFLFFFPPEEDDGWNDSV